MPLGRIATACLLLVWMSHSSSLKAQSYPTNGLVAYYSFSGDITEKSGGGAVAVAENTVFGKDRFEESNASLSFNGTNSEFSITNQIIDLRNDYTMSLWFKFNDPNSSKQPLIFMPGKTPFFGIDYNDAGPATGVLKWSVPFVFLLGTNPDYGLGQWHQLVLRLHRSILGILTHFEYTSFVDGALTLSEQFSMQLGTFIMPTGLDYGFSSSDSSYLNGNLDDIRIYNRALSDDEVLKLYRYEAQLASISINVESVRVAMHVNVSQSYQLQSSFDLVTWTNLGAPFTSESSEVVQVFNTTEVGRYFRLQPQSAP